MSAILILNLPEQGISGPFHISSIRHIIPQKKPVDEDPGDDYEYRPVTGIFVHGSSDVRKLGFDNGDSLGVTSSHLVYSSSQGGWKPAGALGWGEELLAKSGAVSVVSQTALPSVFTVYNLEVKDLHNFLVGDGGVLVHNACWKDVDRFKEMSEKERGELLDKVWEDGIEWEPGNLNGVFGRGKFMESLLRETKYSKLKATGKNRSGTSDVLHFGNDQILRFIELMTL